MKIFQLFRPIRQYVVLLLIGSLLATACDKAKPDPAVPVLKPDAVLAWNQAAMTAVTRMTNRTTGAFILPHPEARIYAIVQLAIYDALNNIHQQNAPYALQAPLVTDAAPDAAVSAAAHDALLALLPAQKAYADSLYAAMLAKISDSDAKTHGITLGQAAAKAILAKRANDGADHAQMAFPISSLPGDYQYTPPFDGPPFNGFYALVGWKGVTPFALTSASQFRPVSPPALTSEAYAADFNEIKALGGASSSTRTADQTAIALFWLTSSPLQWNRIAREALATHPQDAYATARLLALLQVAEADAYIAMCDGKFAYKRWRPITAIRMAATDNNPNTEADPTWMPLAFPNPPDAEYPSGHAAASGAASVVLKSFFGTDDVSFAATNGAGKTRNFTSFSQAADECSVSRIYAGYHFRNSTVQGHLMGNQIGAFVAGTMLK